MNIGKSSVHFKYFPEQVLSELPEHLRRKVSGSEDFDITEQEARVCSGFFDRVLLHPENVCESELALIDLLSFYMAVGANIPVSTVSYVENHINAPELHRLLKSYENLITEPVIRINSSVASQGSMKIFCNVNADAGMHRKNFYAENFSKLAKNIQLWVDTDAGCFLRSDSVYSVVVDGACIGRVVNGDLFEPSPVDSSDLVEFISDYFGSPINMRVDVRVEDSGISIRDSLNFYCFVGDALKQSTSVVLPFDDELRFSMIKGEIIEMVMTTINLKRFQESLTSDIDTTVAVNGEVLAHMPPGGNILTFDDDLNSDRLFALVGVKSNKKVKSVCNGRGSNGFIGKVRRFLKI